MVFWVFTVASKLQNRGSIGLELTIKGIKGLFRIIVLYALYRLREAHGYAIRSFISELLGIYTPSSGILYPTLRELEKLGLITSTWSNRRRVYMLTVRGYEYVNNRLIEVENIISKVKKALNILTSIGFFELMRVVRELWEYNVEISPRVLENIKLRIDEITKMLSDIVTGKNS